MSLRRRHQGITMSLYPEKQKRTNLQRWWDKPRALPLLSFSFEYPVPHSIRACITRLHVTEITGFWRGHGDPQVNVEISPDNGETEQYQYQVYLSTIPPIMARGTLMRLSDDQTLVRGLAAPRPFAIIFLYPLTFVAALAVLPQSLALSLFLFFVFFYGIYACRSQSRDLATFIDLKLTDSSEHLKKKSPSD